MPSPSRQTPRGAKPAAPAPGPAPVLPPRSNELPLTEQEEAFGRQESSSPRQQRQPSHQLRPPPQGQRDTEPQRHNASAAAVPRARVLEQQHPHAAAPPKLTPAQLARLSPQRRNPSRGPGPRPPALPSRGTCPPPQHRETGAVRRAVPPAPPRYSVGQNRPPSSNQQARTPRATPQRRPAVAHQEALPVYAPSKLLQFQIPPRARIPDPQAEAAKKLDLSRAAKVPVAPSASHSRKHQRPWTIREWTFVSNIPAKVSKTEMQGIMFKFQDKFKWVPTEEQLRSQHWYFKKGGRRGTEEMRKFLIVYAKYEEGRSGVKTQEAMATKLKIMTLRPSW